MRDVLSYTHFTCGYGLLSSAVPTITTIDVFKHVTTFLRTVAKSDNGAAMLFFLYLPRESLIMEYTKRTSELTESEWKAVEDYFQTDNYWETWTIDALYTDMEEYCTNILEPINGWSCDSLLFRAGVPEYEYIGLYYAGLVDNDVLNKYLEPYEDVGNDMYVIWNGLDINFDKTVGYSIDFKDVTYFGVYFPGDIEYDEYTELNIDDFKKYKSELTEAGLQEQYSKILDYMNKTISMLEDGYNEFLSEIKTATKFYDNAMYCKGPEFRSWLTNVSMLITFDDDGDVIDVDLA